MAARNLHPYDGKTRRFRHEDPDEETRIEAQEIVSQLLGGALPEPLELHYDLSFYSGGIGVYDQLYLSLACDEVYAGTVVSRLGLETVESLITKPSARDEIQNLVDPEEEGTSLVAALRRFIDEERRSFQPPGLADTRVFMDKASDVNCWTLVYHQDGWLHLLSFDQG